MSPIRPSTPALTLSFTHFAAPLQAALVHHFAGLTVSDDFVAQSDGAAQLRFVKLVDGGPFVT